MERVIQTEKDARRHSSARKPAAPAPEQPGPSSSKQQQQDTALPAPESGYSPDVELSTFVTAAENAREGKELQSFRPAHRHSQVCACAPCVQYFPASTGICGVRFS